MKRLSLVVGSSLVLLLVGCPTPVEMTDAGRDTMDAAGPCASDSDCSDGLFCTGVEQCAPAMAGADARGCLSGPAPCTTACDEMADRCATCTTDLDGDGHADAACGGDDCDDADPNRYPGNVEVCDLNHHDEDCDPSTYGAKDLDRDGFDDAACCNVDSMGAMTCGEDCDDTRRGTNPIVPEVCDRRDNDCDGMVDEEVAIALWRDMDRDLHGDISAPMMACPGVAGFSNLDDDCNDAERFSHGSQVEVIDGIDNDCDGNIDETATEVTWYRDADGDGFGSASSGTVRASSRPAGYSLLATDCDDTDRDRSPDARELCNGIDDDCSGGPDYVIGVNDWEDDDGDGQLDRACPGMSTGRDCNDRDPNIYSGAPERCNGLDDDCDLRVDEMCSMSSMDAGVMRDGGCMDGDGDGRLSIACGGIDCNDTDPTCWDGPCCPGTDGGVLPTDSGALPTDTGAPDAAFPVDTGACSPVPETCNGVDDDCDTRTDEGNPGGGGACGTSVGECVAGTEVCSGGSLFCSGGTGPAPETCDMRDEDCDGSTDEGTAASCGPTGDTCTMGLCRCGTGPTCSGGTCSGGTCI